MVGCEAFECLLAYDEKTCEVENRMEDVGDVYVLWMQAALEI